tara:strand:+ start:230 stop:442 length:213 start_codon:yes stop_codon:yes gene_type:complete
MVEQVLQHIFQDHLLQKQVVVQVELHQVVRQELVELAEELMEDLAQVLETLRPLILVVELAELLVLIQVL